MNENEIKNILDAEYKLNLEGVLNAEKHLKNSPDVLSFYIKARDLYLAGDINVYSLFCECLTTRTNIDFLRDLESFLVNACLDDSSFIIDWTSSKFGDDFRIIKEDCEPYQGKPCVRWGNDDEKSYTDVSLLDKALDYMAVKDIKLKERYESLEKKPLYFNSRSDSSSIITDWK